MARVLEHFVSEPRACSYLPLETASLEYRLMADVTAAELDWLLERGWRRFGLAYFRPACPACSECVPLRIPLATFALSRNQKRVLRNGAAIRHELGAPKVDEARLALYRAWHQMQGGARGWTEERMTPELYFHEFAYPHPSVREISYWDGETLVAVSIVDETPNALSAVYTYHHPDYRKLSLGTLSILRQVEIAKEKKKRWLYLGYRVMGCASSRYKARYQPHELLSGWPELNEAPVWTPGATEADA